MLWNFEHNWDNPEEEKKLIKVFNAPELEEFHEKKELWKGCFGGMTVITHEHLIKVNNKYPFNKLLDVVLTRKDRCNFERVLGCMLEIDVRNKPLFGDIHNYMPWGVTFNEKDEYRNLAIIKTWVGR
jgi:hypothetical protein